MTTATLANPLQALRVVVATMAGAATLMLLVGAFSNGLGEPSEPVWLGIQLVAILGCAAAALTIGFRVPALDPAAPDVDKRAMAAMQTSTMLRTALSEAPAIIGLALSFVAASGQVALLGLLAIPVMLWVSWPSRANVSRVERALDARGARSGLSRRLDGSG